MFVKVYREGGEEEGGGGGGGLKNSLDMPFNYFHSIENCLLTRQGYCSFGLRDYRLSSVTVANRRFSLPKHWSRPAAVCIGVQ